MGWLFVDYVLKPIKNAIGKAFLRSKNSILGLYDGAKNALKGGNVTLCYVMYSLFKVYVMYSLFKVDSLNSLL